MTYLNFFSIIFGLVRRQQRAFLFTVQALKCAQIHAAMAPSAWQKIKTTLQISHDYSVIPAGIKWRSNTLFIVSTVAVGLFTDLFLYVLVELIDCSSFLTLYI